MNSDISNTISLTVSAVAVLISIISVILQFRKSGAFVVPLNAEQAQPTIAVPYMNAPTELRGRYPQFNDENPDCGGGYIVLANAGDRAAFVVLKRLVVTPSFIRVSRYTSLVIPAGEIGRQELFAHNIPKIAPNDKLRITIRAEYCCIDASGGKKREHNEVATFYIDALHSYPSEEI